MIFYFFLVVFYNLLFYGHFHYLMFYFKVSPYAFFCFLKWGLTTGSIFTGEFTVALRQSECGNNPDSPDSPDSYRGGGDNETHVSQ